MAFHTRRASIALSFLFGCCGFGHVAGAEENPLAYAGIFEVDRASGSVLTRETFALARSEPSARVTLASQNGTVASFLTTLAPDGEIVTDVPDSSILCYNMAVSIVAQYRSRPEAPVSLTVRFGGGAVPVQLAVDRHGTPENHTLTASGVSEGQVSDGRTQIPGGLVMKMQIDTDAAGQIQDAAYSQLLMAGTSPKPLGRTVCALSRLSQPVKAPEPAIESKSQPV